MSHVNHSHADHFFASKELNYFYFAVAVISFAESLIGIFVPIYLYQLGFPITSILFYFLLRSLSFVIFSYAGAKVTSRLGFKHVIILSIPFLIVYYVGLHFISSISWLFYVLPIILSIRSIFYFYGFHLHFIMSSHKKKRGREVSILGSLVTIVKVTAPFIGGIIASYFGFLTLFIIGSILLIIGAVPLFATKDEYKKVDFSFKDLWTHLLKKRGNVLSFGGYALETSVGRILWPIFLVTALSTITKTGLSITLSALISVLGYWIIGVLSDKYDKNMLLRIGTFFYIWGWIGRMFVQTFTGILFIDSYKNISQKIIHIPWIAKSYDLATKENPLYFIVKREIIFNLVRVLTLPLIILIFYINFYPFIISFGIAAIASIGYGFLEKR